MRNEDVLSRSERRHWGAVRRTRANEDVLSRSERRHWGAARRDPCATRTYFRGAKGDIGARPGETRAQRGPEVVIGKESLLRLSLRGSCLLSRFDRLQVLSPFCSFVLLVRGLIQSHRSLAGCDQAGLAAGRDRLRAVLHALIGLQQQGLGVGVFLLTEQSAAEQGPRVERGPVVGLSFLANRQGFAKWGLGFGWLALTQKVRAQRIEVAGEDGAIGADRVVASGHDLTPEGLARSHLPRDSWAVASVALDLSVAAWWGPETFCRVGSTSSRMAIASAVRPVSW